MEELDLVAPHILLNKQSYLRPAVVHATNECSSTHVAHRPPNQIDLRVRMAPYVHVSEETVTTIDCRATQSISMAAGDRQCVIAY